VVLSKQSVLLLFFSLAAVQVFAVPLVNLISDAHARRLRAGELIIQTRFKNPLPELMPQNTDLQRIVNEARSTLNPNIIVESLFLYKKPDHYHTSADKWDDEQKIGILNQTLAISTLTGIQYYSASRGEMRTFYEYSSVIDGPQTKKPAADPVLSSPASVTLYARQTDLTFGNNIYKYDYTAARDAVIFTQENVTSLSVGIIPVIGKGNLHSVLAAVDCGDSILIYAVSMVNSVSIPGLRDRITNSFSTRAEAVLKWFTGRLDNELFK